MATANDTARFSSAAALQNMSDAEMADFSRNMKMLEVKISKNTPYKVRDDSKLAHAFCANKLPSFWTADNVVHEMASIQWISETTDYVSISQPALRELAKMLKDQYGVRNWKRVWQIVSEYGPDLLKYKCMYDSGLQIPDFVASKPLWSDLADQESDGED